MTNNAMMKLGFKLKPSDGRLKVWVHEESGIQVQASLWDLGQGKRRPWAAYRRKGKHLALEPLKAHGDTFFSGRVRTFGDPTTAAKAAIEAWR